MFECVYCGQQWPDIPVSAQCIYIAGHKRQLILLNGRAQDLKLINEIGEEIEQPVEQENELIEPLFN